MKLKKVIIGEKSIKITSEAVLEKAAGSEEDNTRVFTDSCKEQPLEEFGRSIEALSSIALKACEIPSSWAEGVLVTGFEVRYTKQGSRSAILHAVKKLEEIDTPWKFKTPQFHIDSPQDGEAFSVEIDRKDATAVASAILQAEKYRGGERSQQLLFKPDVSAEDGAEDELELED